MKISIEIELQPGEFPLATELISLLKQISNTVVTPRNTKQLFTSLLNQLFEDDQSFEQSLQEISQILVDSASEDVFQEFYFAFLDTIFNPQLPPDSVVYYIALLFISK